MRRRVGAIVVKDNHILSTGYNGPPSGTPHCEVTGCVRDQMKIKSGERHELCRGLHAEQNAIIQAAKHGVSISGGDMYCNTKPCIICTKMILNAGIKRVYYLKDYTDELAEQMMNQQSVTDFIRVELE